MMHQLNTLQPAQQPTEPSIEPVPPAPPAAEGPVQPPQAVKASKVPEFLGWVFGTWAGWFIYTFILLAISTLLGIGEWFRSWLLSGSSAGLESLGRLVAALATLPTALVMGALQGVVLRTNLKPEEKGWWLRTVVGWVGALLVVWLLFLVLSIAFRYPAPDVAWGYAVVYGDTVMVVTALVAWLLTGLVVGIAQMWRRNDRSRLARWAIVTTAAWGAAGLASWAVYLAMTGSDDRPGLSLARLLVIAAATLAGGFVVSVLTGIGIFNVRYSAAGAGAVALVSVVSAVVLVGQPFRPPSTPIPGQVLDRFVGFGMTRDYWEDCGFSNDSKIVVGYSDRWDTGEWTGGKFVIWRASDLHKMVEVPQSSSGYPVDYFGVPASVAGLGSTGQRTIEITAAGSKTPLTEIIWTSSGPAQRGRIIYESGTGAIAQLRDTSTGKVLAYLEVPTGQTDGAGSVAWSPDGRQLVGCSQNSTSSTIWVWNLPAYAVP